MSKSRKTKQIRDDAALFLSEYLNESRKDSPNILTMSQHRKSLEDLLRILSIEVSFSGHVPTFNRFGKKSLTLDDIFEGIP